MKKKIGLIMAIMVIGMVLAACGKGNDTKGANSDNKAIKVTAQGQIATLDSALYSDVFSSDAIGQIVEGLYLVDDNNNAVLGLAEKAPEISKDKKVYTYKIKDAKWANGDKVTANDFVFAFRKVADPKTASPSSNETDVFKNGEDVRNGKKPVKDLGVKAIDDSTLQLTLEHPTPYLAKLLTGTPFLPQNEKFVKAQKGKYGTSSDTVLANGPFVIKKWNGTGNSWEFDKNKTYYAKDDIKLNKVSVQVIKDIGAGVNLYQTKAADYTGLAENYAKKYRKDKDYHETPKSLIGYLGFNFKRTNTGNVHLRKALSMGFDKEGYTDTILSDGSKPLNGYIPEGFAKDPKNNEDFRKENGDLVTYDVKKAKAEWKQAKKELGKNKLTIELLASDTESSKQTVEFLQGEWEKNLPGLTVKVKNVPLKNRLQLNSAGDYDIFFGTWTPDYGDPINFLDGYITNGGINFPKYSNKEYDKGVAELDTKLAADPEARWQKMLALEKQLVQKDAVFAPVYQGATAYLLNSRVKGVQIFPFGRTVSYRNAYVK